MVKVKVFGVVRLDSGVKEFECEAASVPEAFQTFNAQSKISREYGFGDVVVFINGERTTKKNASLKNGDEVWFMSPVSGG
ncbi:MAG: MoaD/ThiS family protein [Oscillospiraceae bacterium]|nr:MoaD/ThiS family protein [Oscillospiraceae bacterium]